MKNITTQQKEEQPAFSFSAENMEKVKYHISKYPEGRQASAVIPLLDIGQRQNGGWVSQAVIQEVARILSMPIIRVHEVAAFYTMFNLKPVGKHHIQLCGTTPCWLRGAADLKQTCMKRLNIQGEGISADGKFSLTEVECLGACVNAPVVQINDDYYEDLTPDSFIQLIDNLANGKAIKTGSQIGRQCSAPLVTMDETPKQKTKNGLKSGKSASTSKAAKTPRKKKVVKDAE